MCHWAARQENWKNETEIRTFLGAFLFSGSSIDKKVNVLSGGEKARLALARILVSPSHLLLLDEPTNHLDMSSRVVIENALKDYKGVIICISHDRHFLNTVTNKTCEVAKGKVKVYDGNYEYYEWKKTDNSPEEKKLGRVKRLESGTRDYIKILKKNFLPDGQIKVGITSGASTPDKVVADVIEKLIAITK